MKDSGLETFLSKLKQYLSYEYEFDNCTEIQLRELLQDPFCLIEKLDNYYNNLATFCVTDKANELINAVKTLQTDKNKVYFDKYTTKIAAYINTFAKFSAEPELTDNYIKIE